MSSELSLTYILSLDAVHIAWCVHYQVNSLVEKALYKPRRALAALYQPSDARQL